MTSKLFNMEWRLLSAGAALIVVLTGAAYIPAMSGGLVFDDSTLITDNRIVKAHDGLYRFWLTSEAPDYYPLTWSLWWLEWRLWDGRALGYHVVNVLLHAVNAVLVWMILRRLKIPGAWLAAVVFAIHPVNVATVAWISEQKSTLSMLFYAVAILLYLRFDEADRSPRTSARRWSWYGLSLAAFLLALFSKTAVVMLPVVLLGCVWWKHGRVRRKDVFYSVPFFGLSLILGLVTIWFQQYRALEGHVIRPNGFLSRSAAAGWVPWFYLSKALAPFNLTVVYPKWGIDPARWVSGLPGVILVGCLIVFWWKRKTWGRPLLFGLGYFVVMLFPVLGFFDQGFYRFSLVADHWQYYSIVGVIALTVAAAMAICRRMGGRSKDVGMLAPVGAGLASVVVLTVLGVATWRRSCVYANDETLWRDNVTKEPEAWVAHNNLGLALYLAGRIQEATRHIQQALRLKPDYAEAHYNLGLVLSQTGKLEEAIGQFEQAVWSNPDMAEAHNNLAVALLRQGKVHEAIRHYEEALRVRPNYIEAHNNLGNALLGLGKVTEAIGHFEQALRTKPDSAEAHNNLGLALVRQGEVQEAIGHWEQALRLKPDYAEAHGNLGNALLQTGKTQEAIRHYEEALRIKPDSAEMHNNLGAALLQLGRTQEAIRHFEQAVRLKPDMVEAQNQLARLRAIQ